MLGELAARLTLRITRWSIRNVVAFGKTIVTEAPREGEKLAADLAKVFNQASKRRRVSAHASKQAIWAAERRNIEPSFFAWGGKYAVAMHSDGTYVAPDGTFSGTATTPLKPGEIIMLYGRDFGTTDPGTLAGAQCSEHPGTTVSRINLRLDRIPMRVLDVQLAPELAAVWRVTVQVPNTMADGDLILEGDVARVPLPHNIYLPVRS